VGRRKKGETKVAGENGGRGRETTYKCRKLSYGVCEIMGHRDDSNTAEKGVTVQGPHGIEGRMRGIREQDKKIH